MYLKYHLKAADDKKKILEMFFKDWADRICNNQVRYTSIEQAPPESIFYDDEIIRVEFDNEEDAVAMKLKGVPPDLQQYLSLI